VSFQAGIDVPALLADQALPAPGQSLQAFINALNGTTVDSCGGFPAGQCTALACAWCRNLGLGTPCGSCAAPNHCDGACWSGGSYPGWIWIPYSAGRVPTPGDLVCYHPCATDRIGASGHVDVYVNGNASTFTGFDQNWNGAYCRLITHTYACVLGWQHPTGNVVPPPPPPPPMVTVGNGLLVGALALGLGALYVRRNHPELHARIAGPGAGYSHREPRIAKATTGGGGFARTKSATSGETLEERAKRVWVQEDEFDEGPYFLTPDGTILSVDEVHDVAAEEDLGLPLGKLLDHGFVRVRNYGDELSLETARPLTPAQMRTLLRGVESGATREVDVDVWFPGHTRGVHLFAGPATKFTVAKVLREANEAAAGGHARTRTRTERYPAIPASQSYGDVYGFLLPDGRVLDFSADDVQHPEAARRMGSELKDLQDEGYARLGVTAELYGPRENVSGVAEKGTSLIWVEAVRPLTPAQMGAIRELAAHAPHSQVTVEASAYANPYDYSVYGARTLHVGMASDRIALGRLLAATNAALA